MPLTNPSSLLPCDPGELNSHFLGHSQMCKPLHQDHHQPVPRPGVEPGFAVSKTAVSAASPSRQTNRRTVETAGIEPATVCLQGRLAYPWYIRPQQTQHRPGWSRTIVACMSRKRLRRWATRRKPIETSDQSGSRTRRHQPLKLAALPICLPGRNSREGETRTHVERLMRPCWNHLQSTSRTISSTSGTRTRNLTVLSGSTLPLVYRAITNMVPDGIEPSSPGCEPGALPLDDKT